MALGSRTLLMHEDGQAELLGPSGKTLWASDSDEKWQEAVGGEFFIEPEDVPRVLEYLVREQYLTNPQADQVRVYEELES